MIHLYSLSAALLLSPFARHNENRNEGETLSGVPNMLRPLREPGVPEGPAAAAAVVWPPPGPSPAQEPGAAGLPTGPAPAQQAQGVMYNAGHNGSHFIDITRARKRGVKRRRAPQHCWDCGHVK